MRKHLSEDLLICSSTSKECTLEKAIERVTEWVESAHAVVVYDDEEGNYWVPTPYDELEEFDYQFGVIELDDSEDLITKLFSLLHEVGHAQDYSNRFFAGLESRAGHESYEAEKEAWDLGEQIAKKLNIEVDETEWNKYKQHCLQLYMEL